MSFEGLTLDRESKIRGVIAVFGVRELSAYLVDGQDKVVEYLLSTTDDDLNKHLGEMGKDVIVIKDERFVSSIENQLFPLCGNYYSYLYKISLKGVVSTLSSKDGYKLSLTNISYAEIIDDEGNVITLKLD